MRLSSRIRFMIVGLFALFLSSWSLPAAAQTPSTRQAEPVKPLETVPANRPELGMVFDGLVAAKTGPCVGMFQVGKSALCTHGPDALPLGRHILRSVNPVQTVAPSSVICAGDGVSGKRTQVLYVRASDRADRYNAYLASFRAWASEMDSIYSASAAETGGDRHVRFVTDSWCNIAVVNVVISPAGDDDFTNTMNEVAARGYNQADRKYLMFVDANLYCGIGSIRNDDRNLSTNENNVVTSYARVDAGCWGGFDAAHEHMHNLGGVQLSAPHASGGWHCVDEFDLMCYSDEPYYPTMQLLCGDGTHNVRFDCNHDDYYHTRPPAGSYLATHWNAANSAYLIDPAARLDVVVRGSDNNIYQQFYEDGWSGYRNIGAPTGGATSDPTVATWDTNRWDTFVRGANGAMWHKAWTPAGWGPWEDLGGQLIGGPDAASWAPGHLDPYVRGTDNNIWHNPYDGGRWIGWNTIGAPPGGATSDPSVTAWSYGRMDVFVRGGNGSLWHKWYANGGWSGWEDMGGGLNGAPDVVSWAPGHLDVYVRGTDNNIWHLPYDAGQWWGWNSIGKPPTEATSDPGVVSWASGRLDVFIRGSAGNLWHRYYQNGWSGWEDVGGSITGGPDASSWSN